MVTFEYKYLLIGPEIIEPFYDTTFQVLTHPSKSHVLLDGIHSILEFSSEENGSFLNSSLLCGSVYGTDSNSPKFSADR